MRCFLLLLLLLLLPSQLALHFWPSWSLVNGVRVDYLSPTLYLTDIIIFLLWATSPKLRRGVRGEVCLVVLLLISLNIFFSNSPFLTIYKWLRVYEYFWLFNFLLKTENLKQVIRWPLLIAVAWTSLLAWLQFINQGSIGGLWYWLGERTFNVSTPGIAKFDWQGMQVLRSYATLPHPNALAGWLLISSLLLGTWSLIIVIPTILITFSRTIIFGILGPLILLLPGNPNSLSERIMLNNLAIETIQHFPIFGVGLGNFIPATGSLQPVHNIYLLLISELGIPLFLILTLLIIRSFKHWSWMYLIILLIGLVDHYWVTLHQNILLLVILLAYETQRFYGRRITR